MSLLGRLQSVNTTLAQRSEASGLAAHASGSAQGWPGASLSPAPFWGPSLPTAPTSVLLL